MTVTLRPLTLDECEQVRLWRNEPDVLPMLRTANPLTKEQQAAFYHNIVCNPASGHRYYAICTVDVIVDVTNHSDPVPDCATVRQFIGMGGLTYLHRVSGEAEISLILGPEFRGRGLGAASVDALMAEAWRLGLTAVVGEVYQANPARDFWARMLERRPPVSRSWRWER